MRTKTFLSFWLSFLALLIVPLFFPTSGILFFAPYLVLALYRFPLHIALWKAAGVGLVADLFTSATHFGASGLTYCLVLLALMRLKNYLFQDKWTTLPLLTSATALLSILTSQILTLFFDHSSAFPGVFDLLLIVLFNALFALLLFVLPFQLYSRLGKIRPSYEDG